MPKATRSFSEIEAVRKEILVAALAILDQEGAEAVSMSRLGERTGMTAANLYNYFANKDELFIHIHKRLFSLLHDQLRESVAGVKKPKDRIARLIRAFVTFGIKNPNLYDAMFSRPRKKVSDFKGTPQEALAMDEYESSLRPLVFAAETVKDSLAIRNGENGLDTDFLTLKVLSELHGFISLFNSALLFDLTDRPERVVEELTEEAILEILSFKKKAKA